MKIIKLVSKIVIAISALCLLAYYSCGSVRNDAVQHEPEIQELSITEKAIGLVENFIPNAQNLFSNNPTQEEKPATDGRENYKQRVESFSNEAYIYAIKNSLNTNYFILIDMKIHSGLNRFFLWDFDTNQIVYSTLATHGSCDIYEPNEDYGTPKFSNKNNSHCSSLGKYKIGAKGSSVFGMGIKYELQGLENTNSNAGLRSIVLHSWEIVPEEEIYPNHIPLSWGCPAVSNNAMIYLNEFIQKQSNKKILLWIVN